MRILPADVTHGHDAGPNGPPIQPKFSLEALRFRRSRRLASADTVNSELPPTPNQQQRALLGTIIGGRIGDRIGLVRTVRLGNALLISAFAALLWCDNKYAALPLVLLVGW